MGSLSRKFNVVSDHGLHARPAANFVKFTSSLPVEVEVTVGEKTVNAKSIMAILGLNISKGTEMIITVQSEDESYLDQVETYLKENEVI